MVLAQDSKLKAKIVEQPCLNEGEKNGKPATKPNQQASKSVKRSLAQSKLKGNSQISTLNTSVN